MTVVKRLAEANEKIDCTFSPKLMMENGWVGKYFCDFIRQTNIFRLFFDLQRYNNNNKSFQTLIDDTLMQFPESVSRGRDDVFS